MYDLLTGIGVHPIKLSVDENDKFSCLCVYNLRKLNFSQGGNFFRGNLL